MRAHKIGKSWFYAPSGSFELNLVKIDNWNIPSMDLEIERVKLSVDDFQVIHLSVGYGTEFQALEDNSELLVFADYGVDNAPLDDYTWPLNYFAAFN